MLPSISESGTQILPLHDTEISSSGKPPIIPRFAMSNKQQAALGGTDLGYSFLDTLADIASQSSPLKSKVIRTTEVSIGRRPRAYSEPWLSSFITRQMEDCLKESGESSLDYSTTMHESDEEDEVSNEAVDREEDNDTPSSATLPQMLEKYSAIYNKNGRIGIYTREERNEMISRFHEKRKRRVWKKKIRYHCRKNLADSRIRVKGRFVKCPDDAARIKAKSAAGDLLTTTSGVKVEKDRKCSSKSRSNDDGTNGTNSDNEGDNDELRDMNKNGKLNYTGKRMRRHSIAY